MQKLNKLSNCQLLVIFVILLLGASCKTSLVSYYPYNCANDYSGNKLYGTIMGATIQPDRKGKMNTAYYFDGVNDYIKISDFGSLLTKEDITVSMWVKSLVLKTQFQLMLSPDDNRFAISINYLHNNTNTIFWDYGWQHEGGDAPGRLYFRPEPFDTLWHQYVFVSSVLQSSMKIYKDKVQLIEKKQPKRLLNSAGKDLLIGCGAYENFFKGYVDEIRIYNRALDTKEIDALFNK